MTRFNARRLPSNNRVDKHSAQTGDAAFAKVACQRLQKRLQAGHCVA